MSIQGDIRPNREWILQGNYGYGHGWEDLCAEGSRTEINQRLREYRENEGGTYRVVSRRVTKSLTTDTTGNKLSQNTQEREHA